MAPRRAGRKHPMARVVLNGNLTQFTDGEAEFDLEVATIRQVFRALGERFPDITPHLEEGVAVAIDGEIHQDDWYAPIGPDSEVHLLPQIGGG